MKLVGFTRRAIFEITFASNLSSHAPPSGCQFVSRRLTAGRCVCPSIYDKWPQRTVILDIALIDSNLIALF